MSPRCLSIPITHSGKIQKLVSDYLSEIPELQSFYSFSPQIESFDTIIEGKSSFSALHREVLVKSLHQQYQECGIQHELVDQQIDSLSSTSTFTVTTGQQTGIFLGPLYTTMKILSTISLTRKLAELHPQNNFVPVFWMATEDHDIEEINNVWIEGEKYVWETQQKGAVGRLRTEGLSDLISQITSQFGESPDELNLAEILKKAYSFENLSQATRYLVHALFGDFGLVVIDADRQELKALFASTIERDILNQTSFLESRKVIETLEKNYKVQVNGREINFFYLVDSYRERIVNIDEGFATQDGNYSWTKDELVARIQQHPEEFSPNVMMRPVYQETILPNLAYFGGGAEVSYWLELKSVFEAHQVKYPMLLLRNSGMVLDAKNHHRYNNLRLELSDLFLSKHELERRYVLLHGDDDLELKSSQVQLNQLLQEIRRISSGIDLSMEQSAEALSARLNRDLDRFSKKLIREAKRKERNTENRIGQLYEQLYPAGTLQERKESVIGFIKQNGLNFLSDLLIEQNPIGNKFIVLLY
jgi:bacillithiol biosynthesis cysteine-adding enzyme BshC